MTNILKFVGVAIVGLVIGYLAHGQTFGGVYNQVAESFPGLCVGSSCTFTDNKLTIGSGSTGTAVAGFHFGTRYVQAPSQTISASSTQTVDCQGSTTGSNSALTGIVVNDNISVNFATTTSTAFQGLSILGASASSTSGFITMKIYNGTGGTFTWTAAACGSPHTSSTERMN